MGRPRNVEAKTLAELRQSERSYVRSLRARDEAIYRAHLAGNSLRVIGDTTRLSHEQARRVIAQMRAWVLSERETLARGPAFLSLNQRIAAERNFARRAERLAQLLNVHGASDTSKGDGE